MSEPFSNCVCQYCGEEYEASDESANTYVACSCGRNFDVKRKKAMVMSVAKSKVLFEATKASLLALLEQQKVHDKLCKELEYLGLHMMEGFSFDCLDFVADTIGIPRDNTVETEACEIANATGEWPEDVFCRDWIYRVWLEVIDGTKTVEQFFDEILYA